MPSTPRLKRTSSLLRSQFTSIFICALLITQQLLFISTPATLAAEPTGSISITAGGVPITENFDSLANTGISNTAQPVGVGFVESGGGARDNEQYAADTGASNTGDTYSYGASGSTERALGSLRSGTLLSTFGARYVNDTGATITSLTVSYTGEQWRLGTAGRTDRIDFSYSTDATSLTDGTYTDVDALDFTTPNTATVGAKDGNAAANRTAINSIIADLNIAPGATFFIRWIDSDASSSDDGLAVDDLSVTATTVGGGGGDPTPTPTATPTPSPTPTPTVIPIHEIQGAGSTSPLANQKVTTSGVVTAIKTGSSGGFYLQTPDAEVDADINTSQGLFVFTGNSVPAGAVIGNSVNVTGTIIEFRPNADPNSAPLTELSSVTSVAVLATSQLLPTPAAINAAETTQPSETPNPLDTLEEYEGMRVQITSLTVVSPTDGNVNEANATATSTGVFYAVVTGVARPFREPGIPASDTPPAGTPANTPRFDENPERLRVDSDAQPGSTTINVTTGATVGNVIGTLDYAFRTYTILPDAATPPTVTGNISAIPVPVAAANELTIGSFNLERFFDTTNDPGIGEPVLTQTAFNNRLNKASLAIRNVLRTPDVLGIIEAENLTTLQTLANKINADAAAAGEPNPQYQAFLEEGNDVGGIDVGFLVKSTRVVAISVTQVGKDATFTQPDGSTATLNDRPPLVLEASAPTPSGGAFTFTVIVNHLRSLSGAEENTADGARIREKRREQAEFLADYVQSRQTANPSEPIALVGDFNAFQFNDGFVDSIGTIKGQPTPCDQVVLCSPDLVNPDLINLVETLPATERYSFLFDGNAQVLDHVIVNDDFQTLFTRMAYARLDADFPEIFRNDATRPERLSDHDAPIAYFNLGTTQTFEEVTDRVSVSGSGLGYSRVTRTYNGTVTITNTSGSTINGPVQVMFDELTPGVTLANQTGTFAGDPFITATTESLAPGASIQIPVRFNNPANVRIGYVTRVYSGSFE